MKKRICFVLCFCFLLSFAACGKKTEGAAAAHEEQIQDVLLSRAQSLFGVATKEAHRSQFPDCYWELYEKKGLSFDELYESAVEVKDGQTPEDRMLDMVGENYSISVEIIAQTVSYDAAGLTQYEKQIKENFSIEVDLEAYAKVTHIIKLDGDGASYDRDPMELLLYKINGLWFIGF